MPAKPATQVVIVGGGPVGLGLAIELGQRGVRCHRRRALRAAAADPEGSEPDPAHHGAFPFLGRGTRAARGAHDPEGLWHRRHDRLRHAARAATRTTGCSASWCAPTTSPTMSGCRNTRPKQVLRASRQPAAGARADVRLERRSARAGRRRRDGRRSPNATANGRMTLRGDYARRLRRQPLARARARPASRKPCRTTTG